MTEHQPLQRFVLPKEQGIAFKVYQKQVLRVIEIEGPQVVDFNAFNLENMKERFCAGRTRTQASAHPRIGHGLWSISPYERPMFTIVGDTVQHKLSPQGAIAHDVLFARCCRSTYLEYDLPDHRNCHAILTEAIHPFGLVTYDVHDAFNLFMKTGMQDDGTMFIEAPDAKKGDYIDLRAEIDCLVALSTCPSGDVSGTNGPGGNKHVLIEIYDAVMP